MAGPTGTAHNLPGGFKDPYLGSILLGAFDFTPPGWHECDGSTMLISANTQLFSLIGTRYGGDG